MNNLQKKLIYNISEDNLAEANKILEALLESKIRDRVNDNLQKQLDEGLLDRLGARAAGLGAGIKARVQNYGTRLLSKPKAALQAATGAVTGTGFDAAKKTLDSADKSIAANDPTKKAKKAQADNLISSFTKDLSNLYPDINPQKLLQNLRTQLNLSKA